MHVLHPGLRRFYLVSAGLTFAGGFTPFVLSDRTEDLFAWTIDPPLTAAFLGANFWATSVAAALAARQRAWDRTAPAAFAVMVLMISTLVATLMHLDKFDLRSLFGWAWLTGYVGLPVGLLGLFVLQRRSAPGLSSPRCALPAWMPFVLALYGVVLLAAGLALFLQPEETAEIWPWAVTPLTGRAVAAWLLSTGAAALASAWEDDWWRYGPLAAMFAATSTLQLVAVARYAESVDWDEPYGWIYVVLLLGLLALGATGLARTAQPESEPR